jgi:hypothetical protein
LNYELSDYHAARAVALASAAVDAGGNDLQGQGLAWKTLSSLTSLLSK